MNLENLINDLAPFADIGEALPKISEQGGTITAKITRDGRPLKVVIDKSNGKIETTWGTGKKHFASFAAMLSSEIFANLRRWAEAQAELLKHYFERKIDLIPINGVTHQKTRLDSIDGVEFLLGNASRKPDATEVLLIDGPAGIGKTRLIEQLTFRRALGYKTSQKPLILHVKSRGRVLSNIQDLMAFSLQSIRSNITYDQIPILAKYGVVIIAIDGFDELGDPNGYELAWAQVGQLITFVRGNGTLILAGRDTFIGRSRLLSDVHALRVDTDIVTGVTLQSPSPQQAKDWLKQYNWTDANFDLPSISVLLEDPASFALRPVFLKLISEIKPKQLKEKHERYLTPFLVEHIIDREARLFGKPVEAVMPIDEIKRFIIMFMQEVAREMAESQTEALEATALSWIAEASLGDGYPPEVVSLIKNRSSMIALLMNDERQGYRSFIHSHILNYFLAQVTIHAVAQGEVPKFIRRNLLGSEFLSVFADVISENKIENPSIVDDFVQRLLVVPHTYTSVDRTIRNAGALLISSLPNISEKNVCISDFEIDDAIVNGTSVSVHLKNVVANQLDCRNADLSQLTFSECQVFTLIASESSRFSPTFPKPTTLVFDSGEQVLDPDEIVKWLEARGRNQNSIVNTGISSSKLKASPIYKLLGQACRVRQYWLRAEDDMYGKILKNRYWSSLSSLLSAHGFLREEYRQASGKSSNFVHIKYKERILSESPDDVEIRQFFQKLEELA